MPIPRKKSCVQCRAAKARCSLAVPCERCSERGLNCEYGSAAPRLEPYRPSAAGRYSGSSLSVSNREDRHTAGESPVYGHRANGETPSFTASQTDATLGLSGSTVDLADANFDLFSGFFSQGCRPSDTPFLGPSEENDRQGTSYTNGDRFVPAMDQSVSTRIGGRSQNRLLSQRKTTTMETLFTAKVLLGQIRQYPKMMIEGRKLPPFIHPRCVSGSSPVASCSTEEKHVCMPEILAVCANLIHLFYNRTPASTSFVWETIYKHQKRLHHDHLRFSSDELLEALQATSIYLLLQAEDPDSVEVNDTLSLIDTICDVAKRYRTLVEYQSEPYNPYNIERTTWVGIESARRTVCLLWVIELVLDVIIGPPRDIELCAGYALVPLPCERRLWEQVSDAEWTRRYRTALGSKRSPMLKISDLRLACQSVSVSTGDGQDRMGEWCDGLDEFGALVWMAGILEMTK